MNGDGQANVFDPVDAIPAAARYDCDTLRAIRAQKTPGDPVDNMLAAYNAGFYRVVAARGIPDIQETQHYVKNIRRLEQAFSAPPAVIGSSQAAAVAIAFAQAKLGTPYLWGGTGTPEEGGRFDCSGLMMVAYQQAGLSLPRTSREQWFAGLHLAPGELRPGDLVFWADDPADPATIHHVGMYLGQGLEVDAPHTGAQVRVEAVDPGGYIGAVRPTG
jgi:cell wall-associated NlpC family hydrolase